MHATITTIVTALDDLGNSIVASYSDDKPMSEIWGWNYPPLNRNDLANLARNLSQKLNGLNVEEIDESLEKMLAQIPLRVKIFKANGVSYLFNGSGNTATPMYISLIEWIANTIEPLFTWESIQENKGLPSQLVKKLRSVQAELNSLMPQKEELKNQIKLIQDATEAAESLPTDLESLNEARLKVSKFSSDSAELYGKVDSYYKNIEKIFEILKIKSEQAERLVSQCEEAYRITTTKGLAAAFDQRAKKLSTSMWIWVIGLLLALVGGIIIGSHRFQSLNQAMITQKDAGYIWIQIFLSILSLGAPIWFAWVATKQISQRFRLAEDYAYKASVAKAYEGYKKEAARIDEALENRLFASALTRLEEAPLRLVETEQHGSPWQEFINSKEFKDALDQSQTLKDKFTSIFKKEAKGLSQE